MNYKQKLAYPEMHQRASAKLFQNARELRKNMTEAEKVLWEAIRAKKLDGLKFRRQHPIGNHVLDFYCHKKRLSIELDGAYHEIEEQKKLDKERTAELKRLLIEEIRFKNEEVFENLEGVLEKILEKVRKIDEGNSTPPTPEGE